MGSFKFQGRVIRLILSISLSLSSSFSSFSSSSINNK